MGETPIGTVQMSYWIDPCDVHGKPVNGGMSYANADTAEEARAFAERMLRADAWLGSVAVDGREVRLGWRCWEPVRAGRQESFRVTRAELGLEPLWMSGERHCWDTTVRDYPERVHALKSDGSCACGNPQAGYGGRAD